MLSSSEDSDDVSFEVNRTYERNTLTKGSAYSSANLTSRMEKQQSQHVTDLLTALRGGEEADVELVCGDHKYPAHKAILKINSPYFVAMFNSGLEESKSGKVFFTQMEPATLETVLDFIYFGKVKDMQTRQEFEKVLEASHMMQLNKLFQYCCEALINLLSPDYFMQLLTIAQKYEKNEMVLVILKYLRTNYDLILSSNSFLSARYDQVQDFIIHLTDNTICMDSVLKGTLNWISHDLNAREMFVEQLLNSINPSLLTKSYIIELLGNKEIMSSAVICEKIKGIALAVLTGEGFSRNSVVHISKETKKIIFFSECCESSCCEESYTNSGVRKTWEGSHSGANRKTANVPGARRYVNCVQQYDLDTRIWLPVKYLSFGGFKGEAMCQHGKHIYMVGGPLGSNCNKCNAHGDLLEIFNTNLPRTMDAGLCAFQGHFFLIGGRNYQNEPMSTVYNSFVNQSIWCEDTKLRAARASPTIMASTEYIYVSGGTYSEKFSWPTVEYTSIQNESTPTGPSEKLGAWTVINFPQTPMVIHSVVVQNKLYALYCVQQSLVVMQYQTTHCKWFVKTFPLPERTSGGQSLGISQVFQFPDDQSKYVFVSNTFNRDIPNYSIELETGQWRELAAPQGVCVVADATRLYTVSV